MSSSPFVSTEFCLFFCHNGKLYLTEELSCNQKKKFFTFGREILRCSNFKTELKLKTSRTIFKKARKRSWHSDHTIEKSSFG